MADVTAWFTIGPWATAAIRQTARMLRILTAIDTSNTERGFFILPG